MEIQVVERTSTEVFNSRDFSHSRYSWDVNSSKNNNSCRVTSNSRDHYTSWDPRKANGSNNIGNSMKSQQQTAARLLWDASNIRDVTNNRDTSNS